MEKSSGDDEQCQCRLCLRINGIDLSKSADQCLQKVQKVSDEIVLDVPDLKTPSYYLTNPNQDSLFIYPCTSTEVSDVIKSLKNGKASGPYSIAIQLLKLLDPLISVSLSLFINESIQDSTFPDMSKIAKVILVFKRSLPSK